MPNEIRSDLLIFVACGLFFFSLMDTLPPTIMEMKHGPPSIVVTFQRQPFSTSMLSEKE